MALMTAIEDATARFRAGEAEISRAFFAQPRPLEQHAFMLRIQVAREVRNLIEISRGELTEQVDRVDRVGDATGRKARGANGERQPRHLAVKASPVSTAAVLSELLSVVRDEDHHRVALEAESLQKAEDGRTVEPFVAPTVEPFEKDGEGVIDLKATKAKDLAKKSSAA